MMSSEKQALCMQFANFLRNNNLDATEHNNGVQFNVRVNGKVLIVYPTTRKVGFPVDTNYKYETVLSITDTVLDFVKTNS